MYDENYAVLSQTLSPSCRFLVASNSYGQFAVFDLYSVFNPDLTFLTVDYNKPKFIHEIPQSCQMCSLATTGNFVLIGVDNEISGWRWAEILNSELNKPSWTIKIPPTTRIHKFAVTKMWYSERHEKIYAACEDSQIYAFDLHDGKLVATFEGNTDLIDDLHGFGNQIVSSSEDGQILFWDVRVNRRVNRIDPSTDKNVARPHIGRWVTAVKLDEDLLVCGGAPKLSLWDMRRLSVLKSYDLQDEQGIYTADLWGDNVMAAGISKYMFQVSHSGELKAKFRLSTNVVFSTILGTSPSNILAIGGYGPRIDLTFGDFKSVNEVLHIR